MVRFVGIITLISGILSCITIVGIIPVWLPSYSALKLRNVKRFAEEASSLDEMSQTSRLNLMLDLSGYFKIQGILIIIGLVLAVIGIIVAIVANFLFQPQL